MHPQRGYAQGDHPESVSMGRKPPETNIEPVPRDPPVRAAGITDRTTTHARLGQGLQRLYEPVTDAQPDRLGQLVALLHGYLGRALIGAFRAVI
jgi:hypothetical protein